MKAYERDIPSYCVCIRSLGEYVLDRIPTSQELSIALKTFEEGKSFSFSLSDLFSHGFVYKPLTFNTVSLSSKEDYKIFKTAKKAKYIEKALLESISSPEELTGLINCGAVKIRDSHIYKTLTGFSSPFSKAIEPSAKTPVKTKLSRGSLFDFYIKSKWDVSSLINKELSISGHPFIIESVSPIQCESKGVSLLLCKMETTLASKDLPAIAFRLGYDKTRSTQYFLPGSVFQRFTREACEKDSPFFVDICF